MSAKPKVQHWVPRFYLKHFATEESRDSRQPKVWIFSKEHGDGDPVTTNIRNVAARSYLYTPGQSEDSRDWAMEAELANLESILSVVWPALADDFVDLNGDAIRKAVSLFCATLILRHPGSLRQTERTHRQFVEVLESIPKDADGNPMVDAVEFRGDVHAVDTSGYAKYRDVGADGIQKMFVDQIGSTAIHLAKIMLEKRWSVILAESPVFITTDAPVVMEHPDRDHFGLGTPGMMVTFPLSPTRILLMDDRHDEPSGQYYSLGSHGPGPINMTAWRNCERFMISSRPTDKVCTEMVDWMDARPLDSV